MVKRVFIWISFVILSLFTACALTLPFTQSWLLTYHEYEMATYVLYTVYGILLFGIIQRKIRKKWLVGVLTIVTTAIMTVQLFLYNNLLRYSYFYPIFSDVDYTYDWVLSQNLQYTSGLGIFRYIIYAIVILSACLSIIFLRSLISSNHLSKYFWRIRTKALICKIKRIRKIPYSFIVLDTPSGYGKTYLIDQMCKLFPADEIKRLSSEQFRDSFNQFISKGKYDLGDLPLAEVFRGVKTVIIEDIDLLLAGREATQEEVAHIFLKAIENDIYVVVTGIDICNKAPYFYWKMKCMNSKSGKLLLAK